MLEGALVLAQPAVVEVARGVVGHRAQGLAVGVMEAVAPCLAPEPSAVAMTSPWTFG